MNDKAYDLDELILTLNDLAGKHGIGRIDHVVENRLVGIKSREIYETPGAEVILKAHKALETITLTKMWHISNQSLKTIRRANIQRVMVLTFDRQLKNIH